MQPTNRSVLLLFLIPIALRALPILLRIEFESLILIDDSVARDAKRFLACLRLHFSEHVFCILDPRAALNTFPHIIQKPILVDLFLRA